MDTIKSIYEEHKAQYTKLKKDYDHLNQKYIAGTKEKNELEEHYDSKIKGFKRALEQRQEEFELRMQQYNWRFTMRPGYTKPGELQYSFRRRGNCPLLALALRMNPQFARTAREPNLQINRYDRHTSGFTRHRDSANQIKSMIYIFGDFSGGHLVLETPSGPKIVTARRRWVPFEGRYYHSMAPVTAGVRYSAVLFDLGAS